MNDTQLLFSIMMALAAFLTGLSKGGLGGMIGALITPMMVLVIPLEEAVGLILPVLMLGDVFAVIAHWRRWESRLVWILILGSLLGVTIGTFVITSLPADILRKLLGVLVFVFVLYRLFEKRLFGGINYQTKIWHGVAAGSVAGFTSTLAHAGGPPITIYLLMQNLQPRKFVATSVLFFAILNWIKVPYYYAAGLFDFSTILGFIWFAPLVPIGVWVGKNIIAGMDKIIFERLAIVFLAVTALLLLIR